MTDRAADTCYLEQQIESLAREGGYTAPAAIVRSIARRNAYAAGATKLLRPEIDRAEAQAALTEVARDLHQLDGSDFVDRALALDLSWWPDLEAWRVKLGVTLERRADYAAANDSPDVDSAVFDPVWGLAICPTRDAPQVEDLFFADVDPQALRHARRTVARLCRDHSFVATRHTLFLRRAVELADRQRAQRPTRWIGPVRVLLTLALLSLFAVIWLWFQGAGTGDR